MRNLVPTSAKRRVQSALTTIPPIPFRSRRRAAVLCYHSVHPQNGDAGTRPDAFEEQMRWLKAQCDIVAFSEILGRTQRADLTRPVVAVTFDDGFADNHAFALPILVRHEIPATFFIATGLIDRDPDVLERTPWDGWRQEGSTLSWAQVRQIRNAGMEIGAHGHSHVPLARLDDETAWFELVTSKRTLEERLEEEVVSIAYPYGRPRRHFSPATIALAARAGFSRGAIVLHRRVLKSDDPLTIPRFAISDDPLAMVRAKILGSFDVMGLWQERAPLWAVRIVAGKYFYA